MKRIKRAIRAFLEVLLHNEDLSDKRKRQLRAEAECKEAERAFLQQRLARVEADLIVNRAKRASVEIEME